MTTEIVELPNWGDCETVCEAGEGSPLEWLIYNHEPFGEGEAGFRENLAKLVGEYRDLLYRAQAIINNAIMHGMPVGEEVAAVRNAIYGILPNSRGDANANANEESAAEGSSTENRNGV